MSLSKEIHQTEFRSEYQKAIINILYTHNYLVSHMSDVFKDFDITRQQFNVLRILRGQYPGHASINLIKDRMLDKMSDSSRIVERLRLKGLINRADCQSDKRSVEIRITEAGLELLDRMEEPVNELEKTLHGLSLQDTILLNSLLDKLRENPLLSLVEEPVEELVHQQEKF
jgi:DNA-binding MarR family transcriptional regulator